MKRLLILLLILLIVAVSLIITKPSDEQCIEQIKSKAEMAINRNSNNGLLNGILTFFTGKLIDRFKDAIQIEDRTFYKEIYIGDTKIGTAIFGTLIIDDNGLQTKIKEISSSFNENDNVSNQPTLVSKIKAAFGRKKENNQIGNDVQSLKNELVDAKNKLQQLQKFHFLRSKQKKDEEINQQEQYIQTLEEKIREKENGN